MSTPSLIFLLSSILHCTVCWTYYVRNRSGAQCVMPVEQMLVHKKTGVYAVAWDFGVRERAGGIEVVVTWGHEKQCIGCTQETLEIVYTRKAYIRLSPAAYTRTFSVLTSG